MKDAKPKIALVFVVFVFGLMVFISSYFLTLKRDALAFHTRDYNYFIEQAARLTDPQMSKRFTLNIEGYNMLGLQGIEGVKNLYHAIHVEYFRYTYAILYGVFQNTLPIFIFYSAFFFLPILYYAFLAFLEGGNVWKYAIIFTLLYVLFPATLNAVTADLRPRVLFISAWCLVILAIYYHRPFVEKSIFFVLLLSIREEAILLGAIVILLNFLHMQGKSGRWKQTVLWLLLDMFVLAGFLRFMAWGGFERVDKLYDPRNILASLRDSYWPLIVVGASIFALLGWFFLKRRAHFKSILILFVYLAAISVASTQMARWLLYSIDSRNLIEVMTSGKIYLEALTDPLSTLPLYMSLLLFVLLLGFAGGRRRKMLYAALAVLSVVFVSTTWATFPQQVVAWRQNLHPAQLVWDFAHSHDRLQTDVLLDYETYQAFYDYENILVYNRLPLWLVSPDKRFYPENETAIIRHIQRRMEYSVISRDSLENVVELAQKAGVSVYEVASNERYIVLRFGQ